jgi:membrane fusion protein, multidrug efflux system
MKEIIRSISFGLLLFLFTSGCEKQEAIVEDPVRPVKAVKVGDLERLMERKFPGRSSATEEVELSFRIPGRLMSLAVDIGDEVKKGDVVARLDPHDYEVTQQLVEGQLGTGRAALKRAQSEYARILRIRKSDPGAVSQSMVDRALEGRDRARANIKSLTASLNSAKDNVRYTNLYAPWAGTVVKKYVENFQDLLAKQKILRLIDSSKIEFKVDVPEHLIILVPYVTKLIVEFNPFPGREISATIKEVGKEASETTRTYPVTLIMEQPEDIKIMPGMAGTATAESVPPEMLSEQGIDVPSSAVFSSDDKKTFYVWVIDEKTNTAHRREVKVGKLATVGIRLEDGLKPGEWVAAAGVHSIHEGQKVRILNEAGKEVPK